MHPHLLILGGGSAATAAARAMSARGARATLVYAGLPLGGCCLHVGCVPSKYLIRAAEQIWHSAHSPFPGLRMTRAEFDPAALFMDLHAKIDELRRRNYEEPLPALPGVELIAGRGRLKNPRTLEVNGREIRGDAVLIATGSLTDGGEAASIPSEFVLTNENFFARDHLPESVLVLGGGYIAVELAQMLNRLGTRVTLLQRSGHLLSAQPAYLGNLLADTLRAEGVEVVCGVTRADLGSDAQGVTARAETAEGAREFRAEKVFLARGRRGQTHDIGLAALGIETNARGFIRVDAQLQTSCAGVYAAGDVLGGHMLVYTASEEGERVAAQLCGETPAAPDPADIPWVVFTDPQVAGVGWSEAELEARGLKYETAELPVNRWPRFSTANETRGFLRLFRDPETDTLFGARAICPEAGDLMSELRLIRHHRIPLREVANALVPYLTLTEGIQRCASRFY